nr:dihydrolipoyllysine-residue acetyltransferase component 2 of pyruvate dehydrogenase complex, mitochondrial isoform X1 [Tanacetum cinerariifolium]
YIAAALPEQAAAKPAAAPAPAPAAAEGTYTDTPVSSMRKVIARRLSESLFTAPHFYLTMEILMDKAMETRVKLNELSPVKLSFNDMVIKACAVALKQHPAINSSWLGDKIRQNKVVNIGVAVAVDEGLLVPVIRNADGKGMAQIATEVKELAGKAKSKKLQPAEWEGSTFTISNLGMFGIDEFTAIINPPDACILAVGGIKQTAVVKNGELAIGNIMKSQTLSGQVLDAAGRPVIGATVVEKGTNNGIGTDANGRFVLRARSAQPRLQVSAIGYTTQELLQFVAPSFNSNRQTGADGADHTDPASLRGLGPDQTLVLVN